MYAADTDLARFFARMPDMLPVYRILEDRINATFGDIEVCVQKTQVVFTDRFGFAWAPLTCAGARTPCARAEVQARPGAP